MAQVLKNTFYSGIEVFVFGHFPTQNRQFRLIKYLGSAWHNLVEKVINIQSKKEEEAEIDNISFIYLFWRNKTQKQISKFWR